MFKINNEGSIVIMPFCPGVVLKHGFLANMYLFKVSNTDIRTTCKKCSKFTRKTPDPRLVSLMLTLNIYNTLF